MNCPYCENSGSKVVETRESRGENVTRRRRECKSCGDRFTTYERVESPTLYVEKREGAEEAFDSTKLRSGIEKACKKRPVSTEQIDRVVREIHAELNGRGTTRIESAAIGEMVMTRLRDLDEVAYIRYASIYNSFEDVSSFKKEVETLTTED